MKIILRLMLAMVLVGCETGATGPPSGFRNFTWIDTPESVIRKMGTEPDTTKKGPLLMSSLQFTQRQLADDPTVVTFVFSGPESHLKSIHYAYDTFSGSTTRYEAGFKQLIADITESRGKPVVGQNEVLLPSSAIKPGNEIADGNTALHLEETTYLWDFDHTRIKLFIARVKENGELFKLIVTYTDTEKKLAKPN